jgi:predicted CoA-binding protein
MDKNILNLAHTIAIVGLSPDVTKISYIVASYLQHHGYRIIPVNPNATTILGEQSYPSLSSIPTSIHIDIVDIFRKSEFVPMIVEEAIHRSEKPMVWMQEGVVSEEAKQQAELHGLFVVMDTCIMKEHQTLPVS